MNTTFSRNEFTWGHLPRGGWEIRRHGSHYLTVIPSREHPAYTETYVRRWVRRLNGET